MCTVSWLRSDRGYTLFSSRDEKTARLEAEPPALSLSNGVRYVAPRDVDFGGTWIAANEFGLSLCLLNGQPRHRGVLSRGHVIGRVVHAKYVGEAEGLIREMKLTCFAPFVLLALSGQCAATFRWTGDALFSLPGLRTRGLLTSSSYDDEGVRIARGREFERALSLERFHRSHTGGKNAYSVCMHRPDARTVSLTRVDAGPAGLSMSYQPGSPCSGRRPHSISIPRT